MQYDLSNQVFDLAVQLVNQSAKNIFLTGKAGTGKTTFLKYIRENCAKQMAVVAPTGVAAINAGGVTIHSFFQLPFSPFVPATRGFSNQEAEIINSHSLIKRLRFNTEKRNLFRQLELLVIDEISMVRCDTLDAIDTVLRHVRQRPFEKFGGIQMLFIGDLFQLPPVIKQQEWSILSEFYESPYFFDSLALKEEGPLYIELNKIYRQSEEKFIHLLNQVRNNQLDKAGIEILQSRFQPSFRPSKEDGYIVLATHNEIARDINAQELFRIPGEPVIYRAEINNEFAESAYPADDLLQLKVGAQVMFIKNDSDKGKRYFNGKIGTVTVLEKDKILVQCKGDDEEIEVKKETWDNIRYTFNKANRQAEEETIGSFTQYPLRLAWAITIHKSQGLTFEKAVIDAGKAFAPGQVYVALSRCTNLDGVVLKSEIKATGLHTDHRIARFSERMASSSQLQEEVAAAKKLYRQKILFSLFDLSESITIANELQEYLSENSTSFNDGAFSWISQLIDTINQLQQTTLKFHDWMNGQLRMDPEAEANDGFINRATKAAEYFIPQLDQLLSFIGQPSIVTDSKLHAKEFNDGCKDIFAQLSLKRFLLKDFKGIMDIGTWQEQKRRIVLPAFNVNVYAGASTQRTESPHPLLHQELRKLRDKISSEKDQPIYMVASSKTLDEICLYLPQSLEELRKISGFGDTRIEKYGQRFMDIILEYCSKNGLSSLIHEKKPKRERSPANTGKRNKPDTRAESLKLFREGKSAKEIAVARALTVQTIESHLAHHVENGDIHIEELVSDQKIRSINDAIDETRDPSLTTLKQKLGENFSFGEIRFVSAWRIFQKEQSQ